MPVRVQLPVEDRLCLFLVLRHDNYLDEELWWEG